MTLHPRLIRPPIAAYACTAESSRGRLYPEPECDLRSPYQRDRDRIIHSSAFRRLTYKTQVFVYHEGDHYRTRLTHSLEVAQVARTAARILGLDEDLAEAISLAHDLGHTPFGHAGEEALAEVMQDCGGFDHNAQSLRIVTSLESRYAGFDGLNLTWETLEGLVKHNGPLLIGDGEPAPRYARTGIPPAIEAYNAHHDLGLASHASAEAQVAALADDIAYNNHDLDDGVRAGLITVGKLRDLPLTGPLVRIVEDSHGPLPKGRLIHEVNRRLISQMVRDLAAETLAQVETLCPESADDIREAPFPVVRFSQHMVAQMAELRKFLFQEFYFHPRVKNAMDSARKIVSDLFKYFLAHPDALPEDWRKSAEGSDRARVIADFVAGMTDRLALDTHRRLFDDTPRMR